MRKLFACMIFLCMGFLTGCVGLSFGESSYPSVDPGHASKLSREGVIMLEDVTVSVRPQNARSQLNIWGILLPFFPLPGVSTRPLENFRLFLQIEPLKDGVSIDPALVVLKMGNRSYGPQTFVRLKAVYFVHTTFALSPSAASPGHDWDCDDYDLWIKKVSFTPPKEALPIPEKTCIVVEYPVPTPLPKQAFTVLIEGLKQNGQQIQVPAINFFRKRRYWFGLQS